MSFQKFGKTYKSDLAPVGFFFDVFTTEPFKIPILPIPMRIDKLFKGEATFFIIPDLDKLFQLIDKLDLILNPKSFMLAGIKNFIFYAQKIYREKTSLPLSKTLITRWFETSLSLKTEIPSLKEDFTFLVSEFLKLYAFCENEEINPNNERYQIELIKYCEGIVNYFKEKIELNEFQITNQNSIQAVKMYKEKKNHFYPEIISIKVNDTKKNKVKRMNFVPYLIYDDIIEVFSYNTKMLIECSQNAIDLKTLSENRIINKRSDIDKNNIEKQVTNLTLDPIDLEMFL